MTKSPKPPHQESRFPASTCNKLKIDSVDKSRRVFVVDQFSKMTHFLAWDKSRRVINFEKGNLVIIHICKARLPASICNELKINSGAFQSITQLAF